MNIELQLVDSLAQISLANKDEQVHKKSRCFWTIEKCAPAAAVKLQKQRMNISKLTMPEITQKAAHGYFEAHDAGDQRTFSSSLRPRSPKEI
jgi:hypothetical protein